MDSINDLDALVDGYYYGSTWNSSLIFPSCVVCPKSNSYEDFQHDACDIDIFQYTYNAITKDTSNGKKNSKRYSKSDSLVIRFDPKAYKVNDKDVDKFGRETDGWKLVQNITKMLAETGQQFVSNGAKKPENRYVQRDICCSRYKLYRKKPSTSNDNADETTAVYQNITLRQNMQNGNPKTSGKRTTTSLPIALDRKCNCRISIKVDEHSYYICYGIGNSEHTFHPPVDPKCIVTRKRHVPLQCIDTIKEFSFCKTTVGSALIAGNVRHNINLSRRQCASFMSAEHLKVAFNEVLDPESTSWTAPEQMYNFFKKKKMVFGMLYHRKDLIETELPGYDAKKKRQRKNLQLVNNCENVPPLHENVPTQVDGTNDNDGVCIFETFLPMSLPNSAPTIIDDSKPVGYANDCRIATESDDDQDIVLSLIWTMSQGQRIFQAYPEIVFVDGTHKTNNEKFTLFTVGVRDENFKMYIVLRAFCPNERGWMFEWLFKEAIPAILGGDACKQVRTIITDGDSQETTELDSAIAAGIYGSAIRRRCGWHIVHQGCKNILFRRFVCGADKTDATIKVVETVKSWIQQSIMKEVEDENEYNMYVYHKRTQSFL
jgi:hypothetical protein